MAEYFTPGGVNYIPLPKVVVLPESVASMRADDVWGFWRSEAGANVNRLSEQFLAGTTEINNVAYRAFAGGYGNIAARFTTNSNSGQLVMHRSLSFSFFNTQTWLTSPVGSYAIDMTALTGRTVNGFLSGRRLGQLGLKFSEVTASPTFFTLLTGSEIIIQDTPSNRFIVLRRFICAKVGSSDPYITILFKFIGHNSSGVLTGSPPFDQPGMEIFVQNHSPADFWCDIWQGDENIINSGQLTESVPFVPSVGFSYMIPANRSMYIPMRYDYYPTMTLSGTVTDGTNPLERDIFVLGSQQLNPIGFTRSAPDGTWSFNVQPNTEYTVLCRDEGASPGNAIVYDRVFGV